MPDNQMQELFNALTEVRHPLQALSLHIPQACKKCAALVEIMEGRRYAECGEIRPGPTGVVCGDYGAGGFSQLTMGMSK